MFFSCIPHPSWHPSYIHYQFSDLLNLRWCFWLFCHTWNLRVCSHFFRDQPQESQFFFHPFGNPKNNQTTKSRKNHQFTRWQLKYFSIIHRGNGIQFWRTFFMGWWFDLRPPSLGNSWGCAHLLRSWYNRSGGEISLAETSLEMEMNGIRMVKLWVYCLHIYCKYLYGF